MNMNSLNILQIQNTFILNPFGDKKETNSTTNDALNIEFKNILKEEEEKKSIFQENFKEKEEEKEEEIEIRRDGLESLSFLEQGKKIFLNKIDYIDTKQKICTVENVFVKSDNIKKREIKENLTIVSNKYPIQLQLKGIEILNKENTINSIADIKNMGKVEKEAISFNKLLMEHVEKQDEKVIFPEIFSKIQGIKEHNALPDCSEKQVLGLDIEILENKKLGNLCVLHLRLTPEKLGDIRVRARITAPGEVHVTLRAVSTQTASLLARDRFMLVHILEKAGIYDYKSVSVKIIENGILNLSTKEASSIAVNPVIWDIQQNNNEQSQGSSFLGFGQKKQEERYFDGLKHTMREQSEEETYEVENRKHHKEKSCHRIIII